MNVLILTPDAVGGTFLERALTLYMQLHKFNRPVIDVSHIEIGLDTYYCPFFNQHILTGTHDTEFEKMQSLTEIRQLLNKVDHYKIVKLSHYNLVARGDPVTEQVPFYRYLSNNFFVISCHRKNLFEHALSWAFNKITNKLNVYSPDEKIRAFLGMAVNGVNVDPLSVKQSLDGYEQYIKWVEKNFRPAAYYCYETDMPNIERYILSLPIFSTQPRLISWKDVFGQEFSDYNRCHYYLSDLSPVINNSALVEHNNMQELDTWRIEKKIDESWHDFVTSYNKVKDSSWPSVNSHSDWVELPAYIKTECLTVHNIGYYLEEFYINQNKKASKYSTAPHPVLKKDFQIDQLKEIIVDSRRTAVNELINDYRTATDAIDDMVKKKILPNSLPIKKQTFREKKAMVKNFNECLAVYNNWIQTRPELGSVINDNDLVDLEQYDGRFWDSNSNILLK